MKAGAGGGSFLAYTVVSLAFVGIGGFCLYLMCRAWERFGAWLEGRHPTARIIHFPACDADVVPLYPVERVGSPREWL